MLGSWEPFGSHTGDYALVAVLVLTIAHLAGPLIRNGLTNYSARVKSLGGGLAVAYVFLQLIPEIEEAHEFLGDQVHFIILFSFLGFYALELKFLGRHAHVVTHPALEEGHDSDSAGVFWLHIGLTWVYTWMVVFTLPDEISDNFTFAVLGSIAIGLHILYKGYVLHIHHRERFEKQGRYVLALAPIAGWISHIFLQPSEMVFDVSIAILAGFLMQNVFREELPSHDSTRLLWLTGGAFFFLMLVLVMP